MAVKTITIDLEAYDTLARRKRIGQSFSDVIKEQMGGRKTASRLLEELARTGIGSRSAEAVERLVRNRKRSRARVTAL